MVILMNSDKEEHSVIEESEKEIIQCDICGKKCKGQVGLSRHKAWSHSDKESIKKEVEDIKKTISADYKKRSKEIVKCEICGKEMQRGSIYYHRRNVHKILPENAKVEKSTEPEPVDIKQDDIKQQEPKQARYQKIIKRKKVQTDKEKSNKKGFLDWLVAGTEYE